jgi:hypothetical protein
MDLVGDEALEALARQLVSEGRLPGYGASQIRARYGDGSACALCGKRIGTHDVMYDLRFGAGRSGERLNIHLECFLCWERAIVRK